MRLALAELTRFAARFASGRGFSIDRLFYPFPLDQQPQQDQATAEQVWPRMAVGHTGPEASKYRHQQVGLEECESGLVPWLAMCRWNAGSKPIGDGV